MAENLVYPDKSSMYTCKDRAPGRGWGKALQVSLTSAAAPAVPVFCILTGFLSRCYADF